MEAAKEAVIRVLVLWESRTGDVNLSPFMTGLFINVCCMMLLN